LYVSVLTSVDLRVRSVIAVERQSTEAVDKISSLHSLAHSVV